MDSAVRHGRKAANGDRSPVLKVIGIIQPNYIPWRGYFDFGVATQDHRAAVKSKGAA